MSFSSRKLIATKTDYKTLKEQDVDLVNFYSDDRYKNVNIEKFDSFEFYDTDFWFVFNGRIGRINYENGTKQNFEYNPRNPNSFPKTISAIAQHDGFLWVGSSETGLYKYDLKNLNLVKHYQFDINDPNSLQTSIVTTLLTKDEKLWIGSGGDGVFIYDQSIDGFQKKILKAGCLPTLLTNCFL